MKNDDSKKPHTEDVSSAAANAAAAQAERLEADTISEDITAEAENSTAAGPDPETAIPDTDDTAAGYDEYADSIDPAKAEELDDIIDYYKNIPYSEEENAPAQDDPKSRTPRSIAVRLIQLIKRDSGEDADTSDQDDSIHESGYALSGKSRTIIACCISGVVSVCIIAAAFICSLNMTKDENMLNSAVEALRSEESYTALKEQLDSLNEEVNTLRSDSEEKKELSESIADFDNSRASLRSQIEEKKNELDSLNRENAELQQQINDLNAQIESQSGAIITLSAGQYTVGEDIPPGKFSITGTGTFVSASSEGRSKYNSRLGSTPLEAILESGDKIRLDSATKFSPIN